VLFRLVADNPSLARAIAMVAHLANTFLLLASLALTAYWASGGADVSLAVAKRGRLLGTLAVGLLGLLAVGKSGAIAALGDTLYPVRSMAEGLTADLSTASNLLMRLRALHPALAMLVCALLVFGVARVALSSDTPRGRLAGRAVVVLALAEVCVGFLNLWLLAPVWMQMVHLLMADLLWIALVLLAASALATPSRSLEPVS
jgi:heme A synthase